MQNNEYRTKWIEVWIESLTDDEYNVLLLKARPDGLFELVDPHENNNLIKTFQVYDDARYWLVEEEFDLVEGRWIPGEK